MVCLCPEYTFGAVRYFPGHFQTFSRIPEKPDRFRVSRAVGTLVSYISSSTIYTSEFKLFKDDLQHQLQIFDFENSWLFPGGTPDCYVMGDVT